MAHNRPLDRIAPATAAGHRTQGPGRRGMVVAGAALAAVLLTGVWQVRAHRSATTTTDAIATTSAGPTTEVATARGTAQDSAAVLYLVSSSASAQFLEQWTAQLGGERAVVVVDTGATDTRRQPGFGEANAAPATGQLAVQVVDLRSTTP